MGEGLLGGGAESGEMEEGEVKRTNAGVWRGNQDDRAGKRMIYI